MQEQEFKLNDGQERVVNHSGGPLLVVAGAGTGKTRVIVEKIGRLLDEGIDPAAILAVTFTEKAAAEMLDRITQSRQGLLLDLPIMTFNGFGDSLLREFGADIGIARSFRLLGEQAQIVFFRERIDEFQLDYFLPLSASPDGIIKEILKLFSRLKQHVISPDIYRTYAENMPASDEAEQLDKKKHLELADAYSVYTRLCRSENVIDYDDQIFLCIQLLEQRPNIRQVLQNRYHALFVDEFQDTNPMQSRLIDLIYKGDGDTAKPEGERTLIVVGDDDQAIYGFRGATLQNILGFKERYPDAQSTALTRNYRSHQAILDAAYNLIRHNDPNRLETSLGVNKRLVSDMAGEPPQLLRFEDAGQELEWLAADIAERIKAGEPAGEIAVLTRSNPTALLVHAALERAGVEHRVVGATQDLYAQPVVRMLIELCRTLAEPENSVSLHHTLVSDLFNISNQQIAPLASKARHQHELLEDLLAGSNLTEATQAIGQIKSLREEAGSTSVGRLLWRAVTESGYKNRLLERALKDDLAAAYVQHLKQFFDSLREFENIAAQPTCSQYLVSLPALQAAGETTDDGTLGIDGTDVTVTTIHKAKGLEWDTVYVPYLTEQSFPLRRQGGGLTLPESLRAASESPADEHYAEERRLMYVAATRARNNLVLSYSDKGRTGSACKPSRFIDEMFGAGTSAAAVHTDIASDQQSLLDLPVPSVPKVTIPSDIFDGTYVRLTVSQASALLDCPMNFYYKFVLRAPEEATPRTAYGSQLHKLFEIINKAKQKGSLPPLTDLLSELDAGWNKAGYISKEARDRAYSRARQTLTNFYKECESAEPPLYVEEPFETELQPEGIILRGRFDVVLDNSGIEIRDYKTGNKIQEETAANKRAGASSQLTMYALAWQLKHGDLPARLSLQFVDTGLVGSVKKTQRGIDGLRGRLGKAADDLRAGSFPPGAKHDYCLHPPIQDY